MSEESDAIGHFAPFGAFDPAPLAASGVESIGLDAGATLTKLCVRTRDGALSFASFRSPATDRVLDAVGALDPTHLGVTGCGAAALAPELGSDTTTPIEFEAWARGADEMLARTGQANDRPYLLVSIGTGTSALLVDGDSVERMGGTALGGGAWATPEGELRLDWDNWSTVLAAAERGWERQLWRAEPRVAVGERTLPRAHYPCTTRQRAWLYAAAPAAPTLPYSG